MVSPKVEEAPLAIVPLLIRSPLTSLRHRQVGVTSSQSHDLVGITCCGGLSIEQAILLRMNCMVGASVTINPEAETR